MGKAGNKGESSRKGILSTEWITQQWRTTCYKGAANLPEQPLSCGPPLPSNFIHALGLNSQLANGWILDSCRRSKQQRSKPTAERHLSWYEFRKLLGRAAGPLCPDTSPWAINAFSVHAQWMQETGNVYPKTLCPGSIYTSIWLENYHHLSVHSSRETPGIRW